MNRLLRIEVERLKECPTLARKALRSLEELLIIESPSKVERDAAIQRFPSDQALHTSSSTQ